jgi:hypothetical protein
MMMMVMIVSLRSDPVHLQLTGRRPLVGTRGGLGRDATPPLLTVRAGCNIPVVRIFENKHRSAQIFELEPI